MTSAELLEALAKTGTGQDKIDKAKRVLERRPQMEPAELVAEMAATSPLSPRPAWGEGTVAKARRLLAGAPLSEFEGTPPPSVEEAKMAKLGEVIVKKFVDVTAERQAEHQAAQTGNPAAHKPAALNRKG